MEVSLWNSIRAKLSITMVALTLVLVAIVIVGDLLVMKVEKGMETIRGSYMPANSAVLNADRDLYQAREGQLEYSLGGSPQAAKEKFNENAQQAYDGMSRFKDLMLAENHPEVVEKISGFDEAFEGWKESSLHVFSLLDQGADQQAMEYAGQHTAKAFSELREKYNLAGELIEATATEKIDTIIDETSRSLLMLAFVILVVVAVAVTVTYIVPKQLVANINLLTSRIKEISEGDGDLTLRINSKRNDELKLLGDAFDGFVNNLESLIKDIGRNVESLNGDSASLRTAANDGQMVAQESADGINVISVAVQEFASAIREVAESAQSTAQETSSTVSVTDNGVTAVESSVTQIQELSDSIASAAKVIQELSEESENIVSVLDVIRGIAEQTNLLALNAAIEAARAGEHGRGFAVVADEVRSLASKTQNSTEEIQKMIERLQSGVKQAVSSINEGNDKVVSSVELVEGTQSLLSEIKHSATRVNDMAVQIAAATEEQSAVTEDINQNLVQLNERNQVNRELSEQTQTISETLGANTDSLYEGVQRFKTS